MSTFHGMHSPWLPELLHSPSPSPASPPTSKRQRLRARRPRGRPSLGCPRNRVNSIMSVRLRLVSGICSGAHQDRESSMIGRVAVVVALVLGVSGAVSGQEQQLSVEIQFPPLPTHWVASEPVGNGSGPGERCHAARGAERSEPLAALRWQLREPQALAAHEPEPGSREGSARCLGVTDRNHGTV